MDTYIFTKLQGSEGALTFNFFCESLITSFHTLLHLMDDANLKVSPKAADIPDSLATMGENLLTDYENDRLDLGRFQREILAFYDLAFDVSDALAADIMKNEDLGYYYYIYMQGVYLFFPNMLNALAADITDEEKMTSWMESMTQAFDNLAGKVS